MAWLMPRLRGFHSSSPLMLLGIIWTMMSYMKSVTKSLLVIGVGGVLARLMPTVPRLKFGQGRSLLEPNVFDTKLTRLTHLLSEFFLATLKRME